MAKAGDRRGAGKAGASAAQMLRNRLATGPVSTRPISKAPTASKQSSTQPDHPERPDRRARKGPLSARLPASRTIAAPALPPVKVKNRHKPAAPKRTAPKSDAQDKTKQINRADVPEKAPERAGFTQNAQDDFTQYALKPKTHPAAWLVTIFINILALAIPLAILQVYDQILPNHGNDTLAFLIFGLAGVILVDTFMKITRSYVLDRAAMHHHYKLKCSAVKRVIHASDHDISKIGSGRMFEKLNALDELRDHQRNDLQLLWLDVPFVALFLAVIWLVAGHLVWLALALCLLSGVIFLASSKALMATYQHNVHCENKRNSFVIDALENIATIKSMAMEPLIQRRFEAVYASSADASFNAMKLSNLSQMLGNMFGHISMVAMMSAGAMMMIGGNLTLGGLGCSALLSGACLQPLLRALAGWTEIQTSRAMAGQLEELLKLPVVEQQPLASPRDIQGKIHLRQLSFNDNKAGLSELKDIDLEIPAGSIIGFKSGKGGSRSPLLKLISGNLKPSSGDILIDGVSLTETSAGTLGQQIAYVQSRSDVFQGSVLENITGFAKGEKIDHAHAAARLIGLEEDIHNLPQGYDTPLSNAIAEQLPAGMIGRIIIARALARRPRILLLDNADNILDARSRYFLQQALAHIRGDLTILLVSHQSSLLQSADRIYELADDRLIPVEMPPAQQGIMAPLQATAPLNKNNAFPDLRPLAMEG